MATSSKVAIRKLLSILYDIFTATVSLLDFITDILVLIQYWNADRMSFFYASLTILIVAQLSYSMAFWFRFNSSFDSVGVVLLVFCCTLLIAPILSFIFYIIGNDDSALYRYLDGLFSGSTHNSWNHNSAHHNQKKKKTALKEWVEQKLMKHVGFIIEALIEAFPQSILQLIAIVYFNDSDNYISMLSILLSMLSISTKSFILSVLVSYHWKSAIFNWISCITDIFGIFFMVSFAFYIPDNLDENESNPFNVIQQVWLYSILVTIIPFTVISSIGWNLKQCSTLGGGEYGWWIIINIIWLIGMCIACMLFSISCFLLIAIAIYFIGLRERMGSNTDVTQFYLKFIQFIASGKRIYISDDQFSLTISKSQHKAIRACCVNYILLKKQRLQDIKLFEYLKKQRVQENNKDYSYRNVTLHDIKTNSSKHKKIFSMYSELSEILDDFLNGEWLDCSRFLVIYFFAPLYVFGRILNMIFVLFIVCYLSLGYDIIIFTDDIPLFQTVMFVCYIGLILLWILSLFSILREEYYSSFILPGSNGLWIPNNGTKATTTNIIQYYDSIISQPLIKQYCCLIFGKDTANIIMEYCGFCLIKENSN